MLRCLGIPVTLPTNLFGDNFGVIQSATIPEGELKKKHVAISYHYVRKAITAKIVNAIWIQTFENWSDLCTKAWARISFKILSMTLCFNCFACAWEEMLVWSWNFLHS